jgi:YD repeat-containing protein
MRDCLRIQENCEGHVFRMMDSYDHANRLTQVTQGSLATQYVYNGDGVRTSKTAAGDTTEYALDLLATLPVVISDTDAVYLYGLDIIAQQHEEMLYYTHDGRGSSSRWTARVTRQLYRVDVIGSLALAGVIEGGFSLYEDVQMRDIYGLTDQQIAARTLVGIGGGVLAAYVGVTVAAMVGGPVIVASAVGIVAAVAVQAAWEWWVEARVFGWRHLYGPYEPRPAVMTSANRLKPLSP